jgi:hypothetical protein
LKFLLSGHPRYNTGRDHQGTIVRTRVLIYPVSSESIAFQGDRPQQEFSKREKEREKENDETITARYLEKGVGNNKGTT